MKETPVIVQHTLTQLRALKPDGMAHAFEEQLTLPTSATLPFEDRFALLVERETAHRHSHRLARLLAKARLKYAQACLEDLDTRSSRSLDTRLIATLAHGEWLERAQTILIVGSTGRQDLARLRARAQSLPTRQQRTLCPRTAIARRTADRPRRRHSQTAPHRSRETRRARSR
jgi:hypothetical protein